MVKPAHVVIGTEARVPEGLKARCDSCHLDLVTDGTERARAHDVEHFDSNGSYRTGTVGFKLLCPSCDNPDVEFKSYISISNFH